MKTIRRHLGWKLFFSYLIVIVVGVVSLALVAEFITPTAFDRHMSSMESMMGGAMGMGGMMSDLTDSFQRAINEILLVAALFHDLGKAFELSHGISREYTDAGRLLGHIQDVRQQVIPPEDVTLENFGSLQRIQDYLGRVGG